MVVLISNSSISRWREVHSRRGDVNFSSALCVLGLPEVYVASRQPLQSGNIEDREKVPCQTESLHASEPLQDRRHADETIEGQAEVGQAIQKRKLRRESTQKVPI